jgi:hypothetical protein
MLDCSLSRNNRLSTGDIDHVLNSLHFYCYCCQSTSNSNRIFYLTTVGLYYLIASTNYHLIKNTKPHWQQLRLGWVTTRHRFLPLSLHYSTVDLVSSPLYHHIPTLASPTHLCVPLHHHIFIFSPPSDSLCPDQRYASR